MKKVKKRTHKTSDPTWDTHTYGNDNSSFPFNIEYLKYYNPVEGRDQIMFLYTGKDDERIYKYRILR